MTSDPDDLPLDASDAVHRYRTFENLSVEGVGLDGALLWSTLRDVDWYWALFNTATVVETTFERCTFRGASFRSVHFVACRFIDCRFALDNLASACTFDDVTLTECVFENCRVDPDPRGRPVFTRTRAYGCAQQRSVGFDALFAEAPPPKRRGR